MQNTLSGSKRILKRENYFFSENPMNGQGILLKKFRNTTQSDVSLKY